MIRIADLKLPLGREESLLKKRAAKQLHIPVEQITSWRIFKKSLDARKKTASIMSAWWMWLWIMKARCWQG